MKVYQQYDDYEESYKPKITPIDSIMGNYGEPSPMSSMGNYGEPYPMPSMGSHGEPYPLPSMFPGLVSDAAEAFNRYRDSQPQPQPQPLQPPAPTCDSFRGHIKSCHVCAKIYSRDYNLYVCMLIGFLVVIYLLTKTVQ